MNNEIKILVTDDDPAILLATARVVKAAGYHVLTAASGAECREMFRQHQPDMMLLDVVLPDTLGTELCREIKSTPAGKGTFIILISGSKTGSDEQAEGLDLGADGYIARPISNKEMKSRIDAMVRILVAERERDRLIGELQEALDRVKVLSGLLPICAHCKNIRDDQGYWSRVEAFIGKHTGAEFSHGICPDCTKKYYPDIDFADD